MLKYKLWKKAINLYGEKRVDLQGVDYKSCSLTDAVYIVVLFPKTVITNKYGHTHTIYDLLVYIYVTDNTVTKLLGNRMSLSVLEKMVHYYHSHLPSPEFITVRPGEFCLGTSELALIMSGLHKRSEEIVIEAFYHTLENYIRYESIEGVPYIRFSKVYSGGSGNTVSISDCIRVWQTFMQLVIREGPAVLPEVFYSWHGNKEDSLVTWNEKFTRAIYRASHVRCIRDKATGGETLERQLVKEQNRSFLLPEKIHFKGKYHPVKIKSVQLKDTAPQADEVPVKIIGYVLDKIKESYAKLIKYNVYESRPAETGKPGFIRVL